MKAFYFSLFFVWASISFAIAQNSLVVDSLNGLLKNRAGADRYPALYELVFEYIDNDNERALEIIKAAEDAALLSGDSLWIVKSKRVKGQILSRLLKLPESIQVCHDALQIVNRNGFSDEQAVLLNSLATSYSFLGKDDTALEYFLKTLEIADAERDSSLLAQSLNNIGVFYYRLGAFQTALDYFLSSLAIFKSLDDLQVYHLNNIAMCYAKLNQFDKADWFLMECKRICGDNCKDSYLMSIHFTEGQILLNRSKISESESEFLASYACAKRANAVRMQLEVVDVLARVYLNQNCTGDAQTLLKDAEKLVNAGYPFSREIMAIYSRLIELNHVTGNFRLIAHYSDKYISIKDSIDNDARTVSLMKTEADFHERKHVAKIVAQDEKISLKEEIIHRQRLLNGAIGLLGLALVGVMLVLFRKYDGKRKLNRLLVEKVKERTLELETSQVDLLRLLTERELEIQRLSSIVTQTVRTAKGLCDAGHRESSDEKTRFYLGRILKTLDGRRHRQWRLDRRENALSASASNDWGAEDLVAT